MFMINNNNIIATSNQSNESKYIQLQKALADVLAIKNESDLLNSWREIFQTYEIQNHVEGLNGKKTSASYEFQVLLSACPPLANILSLLPHRTRITILAKIDNANNLKDVLQKIESYIKESKKLFSPEFIILRLVMLTKAAKANNIAIETFPDFQDIIDESCQDIKPILDENLNQFKIFFNKHKSNIKAPDFIKKIDAFITLADRISQLDNNNSGNAYRQFRFLCNINTINDLLQNKPINNDSLTKIHKIIHDSLTIENYTIESHPQSQQLFEIILSQNKQCFNSTT